MRLEVLSLEVNDLNWFLLLRLVALPKTTETPLLSLAILKQKPKFRKQKERCFLLQASWLEFLSLKAKPTAVARVPLTSRRASLRAKVLNRPRRELRVCFISSRPNLRSP